MWMQHGLSASTYNNVFLDAKSRFECEARGWLDSETYCHCQYLLLYKMLNSLIVYSKMHNTWTLQFGFLGLKTSDLVRLQETWRKFTPVILNSSYRMKLVMCSTCRLRYKAKQRVFPMRHSAPNCHPVSPQSWNVVLTVLRVPLANKFGKLSFTGTQGVLSPTNFHGRTGGPL